MLNKNRVRFSSAEKLVESGFSDKNKKKSVNKLKNSGHFEKKYATIQKVWSQIKR